MTNQIKNKKNNNQQKESSKKRFKLFVGSIPGGATEQKLFKFFSKYGKIIRVDLPYKSGKRVNAGYCKLTVANKKTFDKIYFRSFLDTAISKRNTSWSITCKNTEIHKTVPLCLYSTSPLPSPYVLSRRHGF